MNGELATQDYVRGFNSKSNKDILAWASEHTIPWDDDFEKKFLAGNWIDSRENPPKLMNEWDDGLHAMRNPFNYLIYSVIYVKDNVIIGRYTVDVEGGTHEVSKHNSINDDYINL